LKCQNLLGFEVNKRRFFALGSYLGLFEFHFSQHKIKSTVSSRHASVSDVVLDSVTKGLGLSLGF